MMSALEESILMKNKKEGHKDLNSSALFVLAAGSLWGFMGLLVRTLNRVGLASMEICFVRAVITLITMFFGLLIFDRKALKMKIRDVWCFIGTGAFSVSFFNYCYFKTMTFTSLSVAAVLLYTAPAFVMLMSAVLFHERLSARKLVALGLAFVGCAFVSGIVGGAETLSASGILFGLGAGFGYALYSIFGRYALEKNYSSVTISFYTFLFASVSTLFFVDAKEVLVTIGSSLQLTVKTVLLVLLVTLLPYLSYTRGLKGMENGTASVLASIEPVVATLVGILIYKEEMSLQNVIGICLVLGSIFLINWKNKQK